jgi:hypothetical protein
VDNRGRLEHGTAALIGARVRLRRLKRSDHAADRLKVLKARHGKDISRLPFFGAASSDRRVATPNRTTGGWMSENGWLDA